MKKDPNDWGVTGGRVDGNRHGGHVGADARGVGMVGNENRQTARGWDERNSSQMNNGSVDANPMWNKPQPPPQQPPQQSQWGGGPQGPGPVTQGHANMGMGIGGGHGGHSGMKDSIGSKQSGGSGWDDVSPPTQRRPVPNIPNYDDGTSLWAPQSQPQQAPQPRGMPPNRGMPNKMDNPMGWGGHGQTRYFLWIAYITVESPCIATQIATVIFYSLKEMDGKVVVQMDPKTVSIPMLVAVAAVDGMMTATKPLVHGLSLRCHKVIAGINLKLRQIPTLDGETIVSSMFPTGVFHKTNQR